MIQLHGISLRFGDQVLFDRLSWGIPPGERIGLIGKNGAGKTTMLRLIEGHIEPDEGRLAIGASTSIGYLEQDVQALDSEASILDEALKGFSNLRELQAEEAQLVAELEALQEHEGTDYAGRLHALDRIHAALAVHEAHLARPRAEVVLAGLGFAADDLERPVKSFSGGWRMRAMLARLLLRQPDYLLLDEPTNHLDIESIDWLENHLKNYEGTVVIVSHDRYFLDRMVTAIAELAHGRIHSYAGNYGFYLQERTQRRALQQAAHENQQREIVATERFIERFRYKASKAKQVQSRVKMLERLERIPPAPSEEAAVRIRFPEPPRSGRVVLELGAFSKTYRTDDGDIRVFRDAGPLTVERGDKIALIGKNGAGKSTLARILDGTEPFEGERSPGYRVEHAFFAQHQADMLEPADTILESLRRAAGDKTDGELRSVLGAFLFTGDDVFKRVRVLSGGEKSRVALARTLLHPSNFLILDEPTNHLDAASIPVLIEALRQYAGAFVVISHDRHFLDQVVNRIWYASGGGVRTFIGNYSENRERMEFGAARSGAEEQASNGLRGKAPRKRRSETAGKRSGGPRSKEQKRREAEERNRLHRAMKKGDAVDPEAMTTRQLRTYCDRLERDIAEKEQAFQEVQDQMAQPDAYKNGALIRTLRTEYDRMKEDLEQTYAEWEVASERMAVREG